MAIDFNLGIRTLQAYGEEASRDQQMRLNEQQARLAQTRAQQQDYVFGRQKQQDQARTGLAARARTGDFAGARQEAALGGDMEFANALGGLRDDQLKEFAHQADVVGNLHPQLLALPPEQRAAVGSQVLAQAGFTPQQLAQMDWSDEGLNLQYQLSAAGKQAVAARLKAAEPYTLAPGARRMSGDQLIAENPKPNNPDYIFDSESGSWLMKPGTGTGPAAMPQPGYAPGAGMPQMGAGGPMSAMVGITAQSESGNRDYLPNGQLVTSPKGAQGAMQTMPGTQADPGYGVAPVRDGSVEEKNRVGREYLAAMVQKYGDPAKAWAAYNAGPGRVDRAIQQNGDNWLSALPSETQAYVAKNTSRLGGGQPQGGNPGVINVRPPRSKTRDAPSGYEWNGDALRPIRGGPADPATSTSRNVQSNRKAEADYRKEFDALPEVKTFKSARQQFNTLRDLGMKKNPTPQDDIALIFNYMKVLDPSSVVREGEFATAQNSGGLDDTVRNTYNRAINGHRLNAEQRRNMVKAAYTNYQNYRETYNSVAENYRGYARDNGINPERVARTYTPDKPRASAAIGVGQSSKINGYTITRVK